jgi:hypothetical protein
VQNIFQLEKFMQLRALVNSSLPKLSWVAEVDRAGGMVTLLHGPLVEVRQNFFLEGAWNGPFQNGNFGETDCFFGSGGIIDDDSIRFVTSASTTDYLYYAEDQGQVTVSNSLPLLLACIGDCLDPRCMEYPQICDSVMNGIDDYQRDIPTKRGKVRRQMYRNLDVSREKVSETEKRMPPALTRFEDYRDYLQCNYALIAANARDRARSHPLEIWSTQSRGYDTTAVNVIARPYGIDKVFTVSQAKSILHLAHNDEGKLPDDDGGEICELLGLNYIRINRRAFADGFDQEHLYYCARHHNQDANLMEMIKHVSKPGILLTGVHGEILCSNDRFVRPPLLNSTMQRLDVGGLGMGEFRLAAGFIHLPLPFVGARRKKDIANITMSSEMDPWRLGRTYDRPIARRIAEEAGIPRQAFGQTKMGSVVIFSRPAIPFGKALRREFFNYLADEKIMAKPTTVFWPVVRWVNSMLMLRSERRFAFVFYAERLISKLTGRFFRFKLLWSKLDGTMFCFCVNRTAATYLGSRSTMKSFLDGSSKNADGPPPNRAIPFK